ncbi:mce related protein [Aliarcobacter thereius]|uniref:MCE family protein n=2 Tax=Aliarcobacter thereius TaxID=544718 RepID=A0A1C0B9R2_9BACT|nr:MlaD family protein [Aliarcobacter thereius]OCL88523.1 mce related protein [Aliarcobacter thereius]OCL92014.1 mce related protein [Aliarcobacter thereius]OCL94890.1 mce related protein [Aliarcobacter thereius LMG 24486]OCM00337.1 mce related protein [Aliarcobacter thereius]QBF15236.1 lipid asymmetry ABC transporter MlaABCDEF, periplasmic component MlaD [Aliarcobacter thereius LMG 24486]
MNSNTNFYKIGIFVISFFVLFLLFAFWLGKFGMDSKKYDTYYVNFNETISGLNVGSAVKFLGYEIGYVDNINIDENEDEAITVRLLILKDTPIKEDSFAILGSLGITGLKYIELKGGSSASKTVANNGVIRSHKSTLKTMEEFARDFAKEFAHLTKTILNEKNINNFSKILENSNNLTEKLDTFMAYLVKNDGKFDEVLTSIQKFSSQGEKSFVSMGKTAQEYDDFVQELRVELQKGSFDLKNMSENSFNELDNLLNSLSSLIQKLENSPSDILFKKSLIKNGPGE